MGGLFGGEERKHAGFPEHFLEFWGHMPCIVGAMISLCKDQTEPVEYSGLVGDATRKFGIKVLE